MMLLQIYFQVADGKAADFERMYEEVYVPALRAQRGYVQSKLLRVFGPQEAARIRAAPTEFNYQIELVFDSEEDRMRWVASAEHQAAWPVASGMAESVAHRAYDVAGADDA